MAFLLAGIVAVCALTQAGYYLPFTSALVILFVHVFTHLGHAVLVRGYTPGVFTAVAVVLPYSLFAFHRLLSAGVITWAQIWFGLPLGLLLVGSVYLAGYFCSRLLGLRPGTTASR